MKAYALPATILVLAASLIVSVFFYNSQQAVGSVIQGQEYKATQVQTTTVGTSTLKTLGGSIGSIVVSNTSSAAIIRFFDTASTTIATSTATALFTFDPSAAEGTYQYDVAFGQGLMMDVAGAFDGDIVVTYR